MYVACRDLTPFYPPEYEMGGDEGRTFEFTPATHAVTMDNSELDNNTATMPRDKQRLVVGWQRSLYPKNKFDTLEELIIAKILDETENITWVRNPVRKFAIQTQTGHHYPDFVVITEVGYIFIEAKDPEKLNDVHSDAYLKGKVATEWCILATTSSDKSYEYWAIPNNRVNECTTIEELKAKRSIFPEPNDSTTL